MDCKTEVKRTIRWKVLKLFLHLIIPLTPSVNYYGKKVKLKFTGSVLQQKTITCSHKKIGNLYVVYKITGFNSISSDPRLANALFGAVK